MPLEQGISSYVTQVRTAAEKKFGRSPFELKLDGAYADVVYRLGSALPMDVMFDWFSSTPSETRGIVRFPFARIDSNLINTSDSLILIDLVKEENKKKEKFEQASRQVARTLTWIEIGWGGLENFASNPNATLNWTSGPGQIADAEGRARWIIDEGRLWIDKVIGEYNMARSIYNPKYGGNDVFKKYNIEHLLLR